MVTRSIVLFVVAGLCEIAGGYLVWVWLRDNKSVALGIAGGFLLFVYGVLPTLQPAHFGRVYAAYGGVFVVLASSCTGLGSPNAGRDCPSASNSSRAPGPVTRSTRSAPCAGTARANAR